MEKCKKCGEMVDYDNPAIHYGGHVCKPGIAIEQHEPKLYQEKQVKLNGTDIINKCNDCSHNDVCSFKEDYKRDTEALIKFPASSTTTTIQITCTHYQYPRVFTKRELTEQL